MARPLRLEYERALCHVTAQGNGRQVIYRDDTDRRRFLDLWGAKWSNNLFHRTKAGAQQRYQQFVREGLDEPSPWAQVRGQIFLGNEAFLANMAELVKKQSLTNVPKAQTQPTRLTGEEVLVRVW